MFREKPSFGEFVGSAAFLLSIVVLSIVVLIPIVRGAVPTEVGQMATAALGSLAIIVGGGASFFLRSKLVDSDHDKTGGDITVNAEPPSTVNVSGERVTREKGLPNDG